MPDLDLKSLRAIAEKATGLQWVPVHPDAYGEYLAAFNPATVLALLDEIDRLKKEIDWQLEQRLLQAAAGHQLLDKNDALRARIEELEKDLADCELRAAP
jgi:hypothetical protein